MLFRSCYKKALNVAKTKLALLILGETGTGKDALVKYIYQHLDLEGDLVTVDCGAIAPSLAQSELFGHEQGAFTDANQTKKGKLELADNGILFLEGGLIRHFHHLP